MAVMVWSVLFQVFFYEREEKIMAIQYDRIAKEIVEKTGGVDNILSAAHCATRLRLIVKNREIIDDDEVEKVDEVKGVFFTGGQYQIILGAGVVNKVYAEVEKMGVSTTNKADQSALAQQDQSKGKKLIRLLGDIFVPIIPIIAATGLCMGLRGLITNEMLLDLLGLGSSGLSESMTVMLSVLCDTTFAFLPALVCWSTFKTFGGTPLLGLIIGLMLVSTALPNAYAVATPDSGVVPIMAFGCIPLVGYQGSVLPAIMVGVIGSKLELKIRKIMPNVLDFMVSPFLVILIMMIVSLLVIGPVFHQIEMLVLNLMEGLLHLPFGIGGFLVSFLYPFIVITGVHHIMTTLEVSLLASTGFNQLNALYNMIYFALGFAVLAITIKTKKTRMKPAGYGAFLSQMLGVGEPGMFGFLLRYTMKPFVGACLVAGCTGMLATILGLSAKGMGAGGFIGFLLYMYDAHQLFIYFALVILTAILSFVVTWLFTVPKAFMEEE